jgi:hypothetical protein
MEPLASARLEDLHEQYQRAFKTYMGLIQSLPVWRNREQQERLNTAYQACDHAKFKYDMAKMRAESGVAA